MKPPQKANLVSFSSGTVQAQRGESSHSYSQSSQQKSVLDTLNFNTPSSRPSFFTESTASVNNRSSGKFISKTLSTCPEKGHNHIRYPPLRVDMNQAKSIVANTGGCCVWNYNCLTKSLSLPEAASIIYTCRQELQNTESKAQLIDKLREKVNQCVVCVRKSSSYLKMDYRIITERKDKVSMTHSICKNAFMEAWGINLSLLKVLRKEIKQGVLKTAHEITNR